jgi:hypothetical protein
MSKIISILFILVFSLSNLKAQKYPLPFKFKSIIQGEWVNRAYANDIIKTRSPLKSWRYLSGFAGLSIDTNNIFSDSLFIGVNLNNHEGCQLLTDFKPGHSQRSIQMMSQSYDPSSKYTFDLSYEINSSDTFLIISQYNQKGRTIIKTKYCRVIRNTDKNKIVEGLTVLVNKSLFEGKFLTADSTGRMIMVEFHADGQVIGFPNFKKFRVGTDYMVFECCRLDEVWFENDDKRSPIYTFISISNELSLYDTIGDETTGNKIKTGRLKYRMFRQK